MKRILAMFMIITVLLAIPSYSTAVSLELTAEEEEWILNNPVIYYAPDPSYAPYEHFVDGSLKGIVPDMMREIELISGLNIEIVQLDSWGTVIEHAKAGTVDLIFAAKTKQRKKYLEFTDTVIGYPNIIVSNTSYNEDITIDSLDNYSIAYLKDFAIEEYLGLIYPEANVVGYDDIEKALKDVSMGRVDTMLGDIGQLSYYISKLKISNIKIHEESSYYYDLRFAVTKEQKILRSILDKSLAVIDSEDRERIIRKWVTIEDSRSLSDESKRFLSVFGVLVTIVFIAIANWNRTLRKQVEHKTNDLNALNKELEDKVTARTQLLKETNEELEVSMEDLLKTQEKLLEAQRFAMLGELIVGVAHELNTPIGNSLTSATYMTDKTNDLSMQMIRNELSFKDVAGYADMALQSNQLIVNSLERATKIIDRFKALESSQWGGRKEVIDLGKTIENIICNAGNLDSRLASYEIVYAGTNIMMLTSAVWINEIFDNLFVNTLLHGYFGLERGKIIIKLYEAQESLVIAYEDRGQGISADNMEKIQMPFFTTSQDSEHIGLGLSIISNLITREMNGKIEITSEYDKFTRVVMTFPTANKLP